MGAGILTRLVSCVSIMKLCTCFSALVSSSFRATTATTSAVQPAPCMGGGEGHISVPLHMGPRPQAGHPPSSRKPWFHPCLYSPSPQCWHRISLLTYDPTCFIRQTSGECVPQISSFDSNNSEK